jgi:hypothetical protein
VNPSERNGGVDGGDAGIPSAGDGATDELCAALSSTPGMEFALLTRFTKRS